jgi:hypothetical protein
MFETTPTKPRERSKDQELEEKLQQVKIDEGSLQSFKESAEKGQNRARRGYNQHVFPPAHVPGYSPPPS